MPRPLRKIPFYLKQGWKRYKKTRRSLEDAGWSGFRALVLSGCALVSLILVFNIYFSIQSALENYKLLSYERERLQEQRVLAAELSRELDYYSSLEYRQRYAYDSLNLARPEEALYVVEIDERQFYQQQVENPDPIQKSDNELWWQIIFEQIRSNYV